MEKTYDFIGEFLAATPLNPPELTALQRQLPAPPLEKPPSPTHHIVRLPEPEMMDDPEVRLLTMIELRESVRQYTDQPVKLADLSFLLWCTQGVKGVAPNGHTVRTVPSAGGTHAFETYLLISKVEDLPPGLYRYLALGHALQEIAVGDDVAAAVAECFKNPALVQKSAIAFIWTADMPRMVHRFGPRAARNIFLDAGHVCQNLYLAAQPKHIGVCAISQFDDEKINGLLGFDGRHSFTVYAATAGKAL